MAESCPVFQEGDVVVCVDPGPVEYSLTKEKEYIVLKAFNYLTLSLNQIVVLPDFGGSVTAYNAKRFIKKSDYYVGYVPYSFKGKKIDWLKITSDVVGGI